MSEKRFSVDWFSGNISKFNQVLAKFVGQSNLNFLEIGSFEGRSSCYFFENFIENSTGSTLTCVDTWEGSMEHEESLKENVWDNFNFNVRDFDKSKLLIKRGMSKDVLKTMQENYYDFIYVDGSHTTKDVLRDAVMSYDLLKVGGVMTFDDYGWNPFEEKLLNPKTGIDCFLTAYFDSIDIIEYGYQVTVAKKK